MKLRSLKVSTSTARPNPHMGAKQPRKKKSPVEIALSREKNLAEQRAFIAKCVAFGLPAPVCEVRFDARVDANGKQLRKWRFDYCWPDEGIAVEKEGGMFQVNEDGSRGGKHAHPVQVRDQMERYNEAAVQGWIVLKTLPEDIRRRVPRILVEVAKAIQYRNSSDAVGWDTLKH